jgi:uncharacterized membrane protein HdeD (DUF308 family)
MTAQLQLEANPMITEDIKAAYSRTKWALILRGLIGIAIGALILMRPLESVAAFALVIALWALLDGFANIVRGFALRDIVPHWGVLVFGGVIGVVFGCAAIYYYPGLSLAFAVAWTSLWLVIGGATVAYVSTQERRLGMPWGWTMAFAVVGIIAGILAYVFPQITLVSLMGVVAGFGIVGGVTMLVGAAKLSSIKDAAERAVQGGLPQGQHVAR